METQAGGDDASLETSLMRVLPVDRRALGGGVVGGVGILPLGGLVHPLGLALPGCLAGQLPRCIWQHPNTFFSSLVRIEKSH